MAITPEQLKVIKDVSIDFLLWTEENTHYSTPETRILIDPEKEMTLEELFDYYVHEILTKIELDKLLKK